MSKEVSSELQVVGMSTSQERALAVLRTGSSFSKAAEEAGVNRATVYRWVQREPAFRAAYNAWQRELAESGHARLLKLTERAVEVVAEALEKGDREIAFKMLRHMGVLRRPKHGSTDEQVLKLQIDLKEKRELRRAEGNMANYLLRKAGYPRRERRDIVEGRATPRLHAALRAAIQAAKQQNPQQATDATPGANPGEAPHDEAAAPVPEDQRNFFADHEMSIPGGAADSHVADATIRATKQGAPHEMVA